MSYEIVLRELESLLRRSLGDELRVLEYNTEPLLAPGGNFGSTIFAVLAIVRPKPQEVERELRLVAKMLPGTDFQRAIFDSPFTFRKEIFFYRELGPAYRALELDSGIPEAEALDMLPKFYGARLSLRSEDFVDDDAVMLMDNLKPQGYYMGDRRRGLDFAHASKAIRVLGHFHALGIATKQKRPDFFEVLKDRSKCLELNGESFDDVIQLFLRLFRQDPVMSQHYEHIEAAMNQESARNWSIPPEEPWSTIIHMDFWINNILFLKDSSGSVADVKVVDFQNYLFLSPLRDMTFFLVTCLDAETMTGPRFDELLDIYHETLVGRLVRMGCDATDFARDKFDARLKIDAFREFPHCPYMIKMMSAEYKENFEQKEIKSAMLEGIENPLLIERLRRLVGKYAEKGWL